MLRVHAHGIAVLPIAVPIRSGGLSNDDRRDLGLGLCEVVGLAAIPRQGEALRMLPRMPLHARSESVSNSSDRLANSRLRTAGSQDCSAECSMVSIRRQGCCHGRIMMRVQRCVWGLSSSIARAAGSRLRLAEALSLRT